MDRPGVVVFLVDSGASSAPEEEEDSSEFIPSEFIPMGPEEVFRSGGETCGDPPPVWSGSSPQSGTELLRRSNSAVQTKRYTFVLRNPRCSTTTNPLRSSSLT